MFWQCPQQSGQSKKQQGEPDGSPCFSLSVNLAYFRNSCAQKQNDTRYSQESEVMELTLVT